MARKSPQNSFLHKLLKVIAVSGAVAISATNPYFGLKAINIIRRDLERKRWKEFQKAVADLRRKKRINVIENPDGTFTLEITQIGQNTVKKYDLDSLKIKRPEKWDGAWWVVSFDIPKHRKGVRHALLSKLKELGFIMLQKSIWVHPFRCKMELAVVAKAFEVEPYVYCFSAYEFDNDKEYRLKKAFEKNNGIKLE